MSLLDVNTEYNCKINTNLQDFAAVKIDQYISMAGRVVFFRNLGKLVFGKINDINAIAQFSFSKAILNNFDHYVSKIQLGDFIFIEGVTYLTKAGELTLQVHKIVILNQALKQLPDKWSGLKNEELKLRYRYLDLIHDSNTRQRFFQRFKIIQAIRNFMIKNAFIEVETPILQNIASGAAANPFITYHDALNMKMYLRIAPEMFLKRLMVGGFNGVFEIAKCFRNEGIDPTHLQEFTMLECYKSYISYAELMDFAIDLIQSLVKIINPDMVINNINFTNIKKISYKELLKTVGGIEYNADENILKEIAIKNGLDLQKYKSIQALQDGIYKKVCLSKIKDPILVYDYLKAPLAKPSDKDPDCSDQFQIIVNGQEVIKACLEMISAQKQRENFTEQEKFLSAGDADIVRHDEDFLTALEYGMPPTAGLGMGIDRIVCLLTESSSLKDVVFFPNVKNTY